MNLPQSNRLRGPRLRLEGQRCTSCGKVQFPARLACQACRHTALEPHRLSGKGTVYSFSEMGQPPHGFDGPYTVALVRLEEGMLVTTQLTDVDAEEVTIGMPVEAVTRRLQACEPEGLLVYGYKFRPAVPVAAGS